jgi:DNA-binding beta-propeller fold protein YncE
MRLRALTTTGLIVLLSGCGSTHKTERPRSSHSSTRKASNTATVARPSRLGSPHALVTAETENQLLLVALPSGRIARRVTLAPDPEDIATVGNGGVAIVVSSSAGTVTVLDPDTLHVIKTFRGFSQPHIVAISPDGQHAYVTDDSRGTLTAIRLSDMTITSTIHVGLGAHHIAFSPNQNQAWVALGESAKQITILNTTDIDHPRVVGHFNPDFLAHDLSFSPGGRQVWITSASTGDVTAFDARDHQVLFRVAVGAPPQHIAFTRSYAYLTSGYGSDIEKVSASTGRIVDRAISPYGSFELAAADGYVVTSSLLRGTLAIYNPNLKHLNTVHLAPATREVAISRR